MKIEINLDGSLTHASGVPNCGSGRKIHLMSYRYCQIECSFGRCQSTFDTRFSSEAEILFHERCSMQRECTNLSFPLRTTSEKNQTNAVCLKHQCIGKFDDLSNFWRILRISVMYRFSSIQYPWKLHSRYQRNIFEKGAASVHALYLLLFSSKHYLCEM